MGNGDHRSFQLSRSSANAEGLCGCTVLVETVRKVMEMFAELHLISHATQK